MNINIYYENFSSGTIPFFRDHAVCDNASQRFYECLDENNLAYRSGVLLFKEDTFLGFFKSRKTQEKTFISCCDDFGLEFANIYSLTEKLTEKLLEEIKIKKRNYTWLEYHLVSTINFLYEKKAKQFNPLTNRKFNLYEKLNQLKGEVENTRFKLTL